MRFVLAVYLLVVIVLVALCGFGATLPQRHRRRHERKHLIHLQDKVDNLLLQQEINKIYITNLQETVQQLQVKHFPSDDGSSTPSLSLSVKELDVERQALADLREEVAEVRDTMKEALQEEEHQDEMTQIRQELAYLRSELQRVKETKATETIQMSSHTQAQEQREAVTAAWVVDNVKRLQNNVVDLQQALNVTQAMHDKQEVESRLTVVTKDLSALRGSLAAVTSKAEAAAAVSSALQEELTRTSKDMHRTAGQTGALSLEVSDMREDFNNLLAVLPEGIMTGAAALSPTKQAQVRGSAVVGSDGVVEQVVAAKETTQRLNKLEQQTDQIDFALTSTQKQLSSLVSGSVKEEQRMAEVLETERQLEKRVEAVRSGVGEVKSSSVQLLAALEALEARVEREVKEVKQEVAKFEFKVGESAAHQETDKQEARVAKDDTRALHTDLQHLSSRVHHLTLKMAALEGQKLEQEVAIAQCRTKQLNLDLRLNSTIVRLMTVEQQHHGTITHPTMVQQQQQRSKDKKVEGVLWPWSD